MEHQYRYFRDPHHFSSYQTTPERCDICGETRPGYGGVYYGISEDVDFVCEPCMIGGRIAEKGQQTNDGNIELVGEQLQRRHPEWSAEQIAATAAERLLELQTRTPGMITWQDTDFPVHCGDFCCFLKNAGRPDYKAISELHDGYNAWFASMDFSGYKLSEVAEQAKFLWEECLRDDSPKDGETASSAEFYLFQCLVCGTYITLWDQE